jgi:hypothetical protein
MHTRYGVDWRWQGMETLLQRLEEEAASGRVSVDLDSEVRIPASAAAAFCDWRLYLHVPCVCFAAFCVCILA